MLLVHNTCVTVLCFLGGGCVCVCVWDNVCTVGVCRQMAGTLVRLWWNSPTIVCVTETVDCCGGLSHCSVSVKTSHVQSNRETKLSDAAVDAL